MIFLLVINICKQKIANDLIHPWCTGTKKHKIYSLAYCINENQVQRQMKDLMNFPLAVYLFSLVCNTSVGRKNSFDLQIFKGLDVYNNQIDPQITLYYPHLETSKRLFISLNVHVERLLFEPWETTRLRLTPLLLFPESKIVFLPLLKYTFPYLFGYMMKTT